MWEILAPLLRGGRVVVVPDSVVRAPEDLHALLIEEHVEVLTQTPTAVAAMSPEGLESLTLVTAERRARRRWSTDGRPAG